MRQRLGQVCAAVLVAACVGVTPVAANAPAAPSKASGDAKACGLDGLPRDAWYRVNAPSEALWSMGIVGDDPCLLVASSPMQVARSTDGGLTWRTILSSNTALGRVYSEQLGGAVVVPERNGMGVYVSLDSGRTFTRRGFTGDLPVGERTNTITGVAVGAGRLFVARRPVGINGAPVPVNAKPTIFAASVESGDLAPITESGTMSPVALAYDEEGSVLVIADNRAAPLGGVWMLGGGNNADIEQAFSVGGASDVVVSPLKGSGRVMYLSTNHGLYNSVDGGGGWAGYSQDDVMTARPEWGESGVLFALLRPDGGRPSISTDAGGEFRPRVTGLSPGCQGTALQRSSDVPSFFMLTCRDGSTYRYLSSGADFVGAESPAGGPTGGTGGQGSFRPRFRTIDMEPLRSFPLEGVRTESGSIAFDGEYLYYGDTEPRAPSSTTQSPCFGFDMSTTIHRMSARNGKRIASISTDVGAFGLDVDRDSRTLFVQDGEGTFRGKLSGGRTSKQWEVNANNGMPNCIQWSWDPTLKAFWGYSHGGSGIYLVDQAGDPVSNCDWGQSSGANVSVGSTTYAGGAAIAAAGDGTAYLELEDDATVLRISKNCAIQAVFRHPTYSEVAAENDAVTCDSNSFPSSAIWIRDGDRLTVTAYEVPGAYCPLPTTINVTGPARLNILGQALVCSSLKLPWGPAVQGVDVALFADSIPLGIGKTDANGRVCATYVPAVDHSPLGPSAGRKPLQAVFLGTPGFRASTARGSLTVLGNPVPPPVVPRPGIVPVVDAPPAQPINQPAPHVQAAMRQAQSQAQAQAQAQPVTQANPNAAVVAQQQEQPQLAFVTESATEQETATEWQMSLRREPERPPVAPLGAAAVAIVSVYAYAYRTARQRH